MQNLYEIILTLRRIRQDIISVKSLHVKYPSFFSNFNEMGISLTDNWKALKNNI
jgi:hypothetical protein